MLLLLFDSLKEVLPAHLLHHREKRRSVGVLWRTWQSIHSLVSSTVYHVRHVLQLQLIVHTDIFQKRRHQSIGEKHLWYEVDVVVFVATECLIVFINRFFFPKALEQLLRINTKRLLRTFKSNPVLSHVMDDFFEMRRTYASYPRRRFHFLLCPD